MMTKLMGVRARHAQRESVWKRLSRFLCGFLDYHWYFEEN